MAAICRASLDLQLDSVARDENLGWLVDDLVSEDGRLTGKTAQILHIVVHLVDLNVLEFEEAINMPVCADKVIFTLCILDQVNLFRDLDRVSVWNQDDFTEQADDVTRVWKPNCWVIFHLFVESEVFMSFTDHKWAWDEWHFLDPLRSSASSFK